ncbi:GAF domain-containing sensor histidine kinase [Marivirga harenae]|uniref:GAF domain-containing sensor histidine kinase n=1 Tax=Marivirga harenae TaxID=2010992 RepID=UPI0026DF0D5E|nr:GAF domain-containing sensor histidine kinase [Marivirga harenae]WKV12575.1 GAF domain-containing sensor histidine kinase [Marivirga harenae]
MIKPGIPNNENERLRELRRLKILDSEQEKDFDELVELASIICGVPISLVTLIDTDRQWFKSKKGVTVDSTSRDVSFCGHAIYSDDIFIVENTLADERFYDNPLVTEDPNIRFYAGMPIKSTNGYNLGTLCVIDSVPKKLSKTQIQALEILGGQASKLIELRDKKLKLEASNEKLEALNQLNTQITSIISHDLKGPINSMRAYLNSKYVDANSPKDLAQLFPLVKNNLNSLHALVENLLEWSRSNNDVKLTNVNIKDIVSEICTLFEGNALEKEIKLKCEVGVDIEVVADLAMMRFILRNLINNAIKFTEGGEIAVDIEQTEDQKAIVKIIDTGVGIPNALLERIKLKDKKISTKGTRNEKGTGLGLQLVREFLSIHNSELKVESEEGKGSTFSFVLPLASS